MHDVSVYEKKPLTFIRMEAKMWGLIFSEWKPSDGNTDRRMEELTFKCSDKYSCLLSEDGIQYFNHGLMLGNRIRGTLFFN